MIDERVYSVHFELRFSLPFIVNAKKQKRINITIIWNFPSRYFGPGHDKKIPNESINT